MNVASALALALLLAGCSAAKPNPADRLKEAVEAYNHAFRWKNYERAAMFIPSDIRSAFVSAYADDESALQVEDYSIRKVDWEGENAATVSVHIRYLLLPSVTVQQQTLIQHWQDIDGNWILETEENSIKQLKETAPPFEQPTESQTP